MTKPKDGVIDELNIGTAMQLMDGKDRGEPPMACCPGDDEPLIGTTEFPKAEFFCQVCGAKYGFLSPKPVAPTPELRARHAELKAQYEIERAERAAAQ